MRKDLRCGERGFAAIPKREALRRVAGFSEIYLHIDQIGTDHAAAA